MLSLTVLTLFDVVFVSGSAILTAQAIYVRRHAHNSSRVALAGLARSAALWTWAGLVFGILCALGGELLAALIAPGFRPEARAIFARCCVIGCLLPAATALMTFASALNRINGREVLFTVNPLIINSVSWLAIAVAAFLGATSLGIIQAFLVSVVLSTLAMFAWQLRCMEPTQRHWLRAHFARALLPRRLLLRARLHRRELRAVSPIFGALLIQQVVTLISYAFVTRAGAGVLLLFGLAERLVNVIFAVFIMTFITVLEPRWARAAVTPGRSREISDDVAIICAALIPLTATLMFAGDSLAALLFGHGAVNARDVGELGDITRIYALALPGLSLGLVLTRLLVIRNHGGHIFLVNVGVTVLHLALCSAGFALAGARGVGAALAVTLGVQAAAFALQLARGGDRAARAERIGIGARLVLLALLVIAVGWAADQIELGFLAHLVTVSCATLLTTFAGGRLLGLKLLGSVRRLARL